MATYIQSLIQKISSADKEKSNAHSSQAPSTSGATATAIAKEEIRLEPGEIPKSMRSTSKNTAMNKTMLDTAMWQLLASQMLQQQASLKMNGHPVRSSKKEVPNSVNSGVLDLSGKNISEPGERLVKNINEVKYETILVAIILEPFHGWRRQTCIRSINASGVRGDVVYYAPCGKKLSTYAEVLRYLMKNNCGNITRDNFSFSSKLVVGEFLMPKETKLIIKMTEDEISEEMNRLFRLKPPPRTTDKKTRDERVTPEEVCHRAIDHFEETEGAYDDEEKIKWSREPIDDLLLIEIRVSRERGIMALSKNIIVLVIIIFAFRCFIILIQYWQLPHVPAVLVESVESAGVTNPACNAGQICGKDPQGVSGSHFIDPDVAACIEDVIDEVVAAKVHGDRKRRKRIRRMENAFKRGWWTIDTRLVYSTIYLIIIGNEYSIRLHHRSAIMATVRRTHMSHMTP
uniref:MBD domain-containing protein n=1 Tax=Heterorhabditis bacteriophora TaxID=37862 RepID=A0A1I7X823_HETBA